MKTNLSVITVTYNNEDHIKDYLTGLKKHLPENSELIILDSNSTDETLKFINDFLDQNRDFSKKIILIKSSQNVGYGRGNNLAVSKSSGELLFLLNPDTYIEKDIFSPLIKYYQDHDDIGIVAPQLIMPSGQIQKTIKKEPTIMGVLKEYYFGEKNAYSEYSPEGTDPIEVESVYGAAMLIKKELFEKVGGFDERYFLYYEDADLCRKVRQLGKKIIYFPGASLNHYVGGSKDNSSKKMPIGVRTLSWFIPIKSAGRNYYQVKSRNIYHGIPTSFLIALLLYLSTKLKK